MKRIDLSGEWELFVAKRGKPHGAAIPMRIPGDVFSALIDAGKIPDPYYGTNELDTLWVGREDWIVSRTLDIPADFLRNRRLYLHFDSLDTMAEIRINGKTAAESSNMFSALRVEVGQLLQSGDNLLEILLHSAEKRAAELSRRLRYEVPYSRYPVQSPHRNLVRKVQCHSGWDWGPCLLVSGIYGLTYLAGCELGRIEYVTTQHRCGGRDWTLEVSVEYFAFASGSILLAISIAGLKVSRKVAVAAGCNTIREQLLIPEPELWWPRGYGGQRLYTLDVEAGEDRLSKQIGFRTIELQLEDDAAGRGMVFCVNGRKIFCKGVNWIPVDALPARQTMDRYRQLLADAAEANMNMLRVWGGGQYETQSFYELCDESGLMVWQDFMFACSTYPAGDWFLEEVRTEIRHQVKRLMDHPCIVLWCGNNENLGALQWYPEGRANPARYLVDYDRLNEGVVGRTVRETDPGRPWWPSSPSAGVDEYTDNWHDDSKGDMHYWSVWHEGKSFAAYYEVTPRFCSEFGFQSFPSPETVRSFAPPDHWNVTSPVMEHHQRHPRGNSIIVESMTRYFRMPAGFESTLYLSQVQQALAMKTAVEYWRSRRPLCMGILYWQLNDVWPVASWSSIEYSGKWKPLHYAARRFYAPVHVAVFSTDRHNVRIVGLNDTPEPFEGTLRVQVIGFDGRIHRSRVRRVRLVPEAATPLAVRRMDRMPVADTDGFLFVELTGGGKERPERWPVAVNEFFLCAPKRCNLQIPQICAQVRRKGAQAEIELSTDFPAFFVSLDTDGLPGVFDDNLFTLLPDRPRILRFMPRVQPQGDLRTELERNLKIFHLRKTYE